MEGIFMSTGEDGGDREEKTGTAWSTIAEVGRLSAGSM